PFPFPLIGNLHLFHGEIDNVFFNLQAKYGEIFEVFIGSELTNKGIGLNTDLNSWKYNRTMVTQSIMIPSFLRQFVQDIEKFFNELDEYWLVSGDELDFSNGSTSLRTI
ncbi:9963_t:CDS:2, partial [Dentiscutata erythropus]